MENVAGVVFAAGLGTRMLPLTQQKPKALFPVNNVALIDIAIARMRQFTADIAVNSFHLAEQVIEHVGDHVHVSVEPHLLGTAGALFALKDWIADRDVLVTNSDAWFDHEIPQMLGHSDQVQMLIRNEIVNPDFNNMKSLGTALIPRAIVDRLETQPVSLWDAVFRPAIQDDEVTFVQYEGKFFDCGTPQDYLEANLTAAGLANVVGADSIVEGTIDHCVVWPRAHVTKSEKLAYAVRGLNGLTLNCK